MTPLTAPIRLCIIGCGAHTELAYLPALSTMPEFILESLIDLDLERCRCFAERYNIPHYASTIDDLPLTVQAAVVALPHYLHSPVSCELLKRSIHVLCEKPMATTKADAEAMVDCARQNAAYLHIGNVFRHYWTSKRVKHMIASNSLGELVSFDIEVGYVHNWPTTSGFFFDRQKSGGGVLIDIGAHVLDLLLWWLQDYPISVTYHDDNMGGVEADCRLELTFSPSITGTLRLSRLMTLKNTFSLVFTQGSLTFQPYDSSGICNTITMNRHGQITLIEADRRLHYEDYCQEQLLTFHRIITSKNHSISQAKSIVPSIQLIEECYQRAECIDAPWLDVNESSKVLPKHKHLDMQEAKVAVTGAAGFIGGRVAERLYCDYNNLPICLVRNFNKLARLSRIPAHIMVSDVLDYDSLVRSLSGVDIIIHCAYGNTSNESENNRINILGIQNLLEAALHHKIKKVVYLSSVEVYGINQPKFVDETTETHPAKYDYGNSKLTAEELCRQYFKESGLPLVILRLSVVYGPHSPIWTIGVINRLRNRGFALCDQFNGICNPLYIDDCVDAIFLAAMDDAVAGETFIISSGEQLTWNDYFIRYNAMLHLPPLQHAIKMRLQLYWLIRKMFDVGFDYLRPKYGHDLLFTYGHLRERGRIPNVKALLQQGSLWDSIDIFSRPTYYVIDKARERLGFEPKYNLERGLHVVERWLNL